MVSTTSRVKWVWFQLFKWQISNIFALFLAATIKKELSKETFKVATRLEQLLKARMMFIKGRI